MSLEGGPSFRQQDEKDTSSWLLLSLSYGRDIIYCFLKEGTSQLLLGNRYDCKWSLSFKCRLHLARSSGGDSTPPLRSFLMVGLPLAAWECFPFCRSRCAVLAGPVLSPSPLLGSWWPWTVTPGSNQSPVTSSCLSHLCHLEMQASRWSPGFAPYKHWWNML